MRRRREDEVIDYIISKKDPMNWLESNSVPQLEEDGVDMDNPEPHATIALDCRIRAIRPINE